MIVTVDHYDYGDQKVIHSVKITYDPPMTVDSDRICLIQADIASIFDNDILVPEVFSDPVSTESSPGT